MNSIALNILFVVIYDWFASRENIVSVWHLIYILFLISLFYLFHKISKTRNAKASLYRSYKHRKSIKMDKNKEENISTPHQQDFSSKNISTPLKKLTAEEIEYFVESFKQHLKRQEEAQLKSKDISEENTTTKNCDIVKSKPLSNQNDEVSPIQVHEIPFNKLAEKRPKKFAEPFQNHLQYLDCPQDGLQSNALIAINREDLKVNKRISDQANEDSPFNNTSEHFQNHLQSTNKPQDRLLSSARIVIDNKDLKENPKISVQVNQDSTPKNTSEELQEKLLTHIKEVDGTVKGNLRMTNEKIWGKYLEKNSKSESVTSQSEYYKPNIAKIENSWSRNQETLSQMTSSKISTEAAKKIDDIKEIPTPVNPDSLPRDSLIQINIPNLKEVQKMVKTEKNNLRIIEKIWFKYQEIISETNCISNQKAAAEIEERFAEIKEALGTSEYLLNEIEIIKSFYQQSISKNISSIKKTEDSKEKLKFIATVDKDLPEYDTLGKFLKNTTSNNKNEGQRHFPDTTFKKSATNLTSTLIGPPTKGKSTKTSPNC